MLVRIGGPGNPRCWYKCKLVQPRCTKKLKIDLPYDPAIPLLGTYVKKYKSCTPTLITTLCTITQLWNQPGSPTTENETFIVTEILLKVKVHLQM
jgi:hypothetical protein